jgi:hypothetical protein
MVRELFFWACLLGTYYVPACAQFTAVDQGCEFEAPPSRGVRVYTTLEPCIKMFSEESSQGLSFATPRVPAGSMPANTVALATTAPSPSA